MEQFRKLNEQDIIQALADHYNVDRDRVRLKIENRWEGHGPTEHKVPTASAIIREE